MTAQPLDQGFKANMQETATKTPLSIRETPQSISVITQDSLKARQAQDLGQALGDRWLATLRVNGSTQDTPIDLDRYAYGISPGGDFSLYSSAFEFDTDAWSGEIRLDGKLDIQGKPLNLTFGVDHHDLEAARTDSYAVLGTANIYEENFDDFPTMDLNLTRDEVAESNGTGVYVQGHFRPFERLGLLAGVRMGRWGCSAVTSCKAGCCAAWALAWASSQSTIAA